MIIQLDSKTNKINTAYLLHNSNLNFLKEQVNSSLSGAWRQKRPALTEGQQHVTVGDLSMFCLNCMTVKVFLIATATSLKIVGQHLAPLDVLIITWSHFHGKKNRKNMLIPTKV